MAAVLRAEGGGYVHLHLRVNECIRYNDSDQVAPISILHIIHIRGMISAIFTLNRIFLDLNKAVWIERGITYSTNAVTNTV